MSRNGNGKKPEPVDTSAVSTPRLFMDLGNALVKWIYGREKGCFLHAYAPITASDYQRALSRHGSSLPLDYIKIGGEHYVVGESAEQHVVKTLQGAPRYTREYYGPFLCRVMAQIFAEGAEPGSIDVTASHAPIDIEYRDQITAAIKGRWDFTAGPYTLRANVGRVAKYDELYGGYCNRNAKVVYDNRNQIVRVENPLANQRTGILDIGGGTISVLVVSENGLVEYERAHSETGVAINFAMQNLKQILKRDYSELFSRVQDIPAAAVRKAMRENTINVAGKRLGVEEQVQEAVAPVLSVCDRLCRTHMDAGIGIDALLITGGGGGNLQGRLQVELGHNNMLLASDNLDEMHFANVMGAATLWEIKERAI